MKNKNCPICDKNMIDFERYPKMICHECVLLTTTENGETIKFYNIDHTGGFLSIVNNVKGINRVVYDISSKPPSTIELE